MMPLAQQILANVLSVVLLILVFELVRRRKLREEYSVLWLLLGVTVLLLSNFFSAAQVLGEALNASTTAVVFFFGMLFLLLIALHYSVKISRLTQQVKNLAQEVTLLRGHERRSRGG